jgi:hypothetical protein
MEGTEEYKSSMAFYEARQVMYELSPEYPINVNTIAGRKGRFVWGGFSRCRIEGRGGGFCFSLTEKFPEGGISD